MKLLHGTDKRFRDGFWMWSNRIGELLSICAFLASLGCLVWFIVIHENVLIDLICVFIAIAAPFALYDASWRNTAYSLDESGITLCSLLEKKRFSWENVTGCGVFPIYLANADIERDYIVLFLKKDRPEFPINLMTCCWKTDSMITIRKTDERLAEVKEYMNRYIV